MPTHLLPPRRLMVVINPKSGPKHSGIDPEMVATALSEITYTDQNGRPCRYNIDLRLTEHPGHASELAREAVENEYYGVLACGGDGTVNETARALCGTDVVLGILPMGSGNGLARHLGIPINLRGAIKVIAEDRVLDSDYATANGRPFFCTFGVGFDAEVTKKFNRRKGRGLKTYLLTVLEEYITYKSEKYTITANGLRLTEEALIVACCNASQYGNNAYIAPHASVKDGLLDITIVHSGSLLGDAGAAFDILSGLAGSTAQTSTFRTDRLCIHRPHPGAAHFDGEAASLPEDIEVVCHPGRLKVFSTEKKSRLRPIMSPQIPFLSPLALTIRDLHSRIISLFQS